jgi:hypothetical protein
MERSDPSQEHRPINASGPTRTQVARRDPDPTIAGRSD